ncbi:MAG: AAA family ATPase [Candidatus Omnitrophica bacterium]|nr:AAA family ATPase [Candidatus Omnitrophota bacterium]
MYFKKLELIGFKSFADKTTLHFEPGITAVVGPNGCGKSNIFDSIRWVLGEQSIKQLRGSQSQDVIFNGSDSKEALGMAEVSLTFDNTNRYFSVDNNEVAISRRIFRSGESEYLLNKQQVRLKDILDLLLGTGIGSESYSLVQQGKIDLVLSSQPEDRRLVFDEASGITKYKAQKKEATRKLEETEQNLLRLNDIIVEVKRQIGSLERQANKARRYKEVFEELKTKEISLGLLQKDSIAKLKDTLIVELRDLELKESQILESIKDQEAKISTRQREIKDLEECLQNIKNLILNLENQISRNTERVNLNQERIIELEERKTSLQEQLAQLENRIVLDEEKLNTMKAEFAANEQKIEEKKAVLNQKQAELETIGLNIKNALENIARAKKDVLEIAAKLASAKNQIADLVSQQQIYLARKKRLDIEKAKAAEEKFQVSESLNKINQELASMESDFSQLSLKISELKTQIADEEQSLGSVISDIQNLENQSLSLASQKEFLEKLKSKYDDISEVMNAVVILDEPPKEKVSGLVIKIKGASEEEKNKLYGEAKSFELDASKIIERLEEIQHKIDSLNVIKNLKENTVSGFKKDSTGLEAALRTQELALIDKRAIQKNVLEQANRITEEENILNLELEEVDAELVKIQEGLNNQQGEFAGLEKLQRANDDLIQKEQTSINLENLHKEETVVAITQVKTEIDGFLNRINSDKDALKMIEDAYNQEKDNILAINNQIQEEENRRLSLEAEITDLNQKKSLDSKNIESQNQLLKEKEAQYAKISEDSGGDLQAIDTQRKELDTLKNRLYELQMQNKDLDFKFLSLKERILQGYKIDLEAVLDPAPDIIEEAVSGEIQKLKEKLDSYGTVNLVAIEEYDELKKRYDFLTQQQTDLLTAKESLHNAILKINRTTKQMFIETFEKVKVEFRNYFRLLFNGGDAQLFLTDEQDPLESGIEIICRPPGKKLQNVLLLSGGEKSLSAIALIFAIFKIKPAPFCILDEIDAALDEANVDRYSKMLHEFSHTSQFIVITHNKKTIANADIMYGITMQESGVSKIVSVKFAKDKPLKDKEPEALAQPV